MKIYIIIFIISVVSFIAYLAIRDYKAMKFNNNMQEGQRCLVQKWYFLKRWRNPHVS